MTPNGEPARGVGELVFAAEGALATLSADALRALLERGAYAPAALSATVARIIDEVQHEGDGALKRFAREFDGVALDTLEVPMAAAHAALKTLDPDLRDALGQARDAIAAVHRAQLPVAQEIEVSDGVLITRRPDPLGRVGVYAPGGRAAYPSSVLMGVVPARVAGVHEVIVCSPPGAAGAPPAAVLAACALAGADRIFAVGGAGAIAALAHGTATIPRVDRIVGPGNAYVAEAKRQLTGVVGIDCPAGPSEILIIADDTAEADVIAVEMLAQAEHDPDAAAVLVATSPSLPEAVRARIAETLGRQPRRAIIEAALAARGALLFAEDETAAIRFACRYAPEHLLVLTREPGTTAAAVRGAGTVFLGPASSVAFGDYLTGANHVLPTGGLARTYTGLSIADFVRWTTIQRVSPSAAAEMALPTASMADAEGLPAHAQAALLRAQLPAAAGATTPRSPPALRPAYAEIRNYDPQRRPCAVDLSDNTNLFGVAPSAAQALADAPPSLLTRYPAVYADALKRALARLFGVDPANVTTGCGSDDVIDSAVRAFCEPGDTLACAAPTFGVVPLFARMNAVQPVEVALAPGFALDADALLRARARVTYVCRPNNPTGTLFDRSSIERVMRESAGVVLIDEAYADFAGDDVMHTALASERAVVLRTLSKAWALAGLRIGMALGPARLITEIEKSRGPYKVSAAAEAAALAVLARDGAWVQATIAAVVEKRARLADALEALGLNPLPSAANFLLLPVPPRLGTAGGLADALRERGVAVRAFPALAQVGDAIRITIGPWPMLQALLDILEPMVERGVTAAEPERNA